MQSSAPRTFIRHDELDDTLRIARILVPDDRDLIHKAVGWLREVDKRDKAVLEGFLEDHGHELPRTALRYSIEHMHPEKKRYFLRLRERRSSSTDERSRACGVEPTARAARRLLRAALSAIRSW